MTLGGSGGYRGQIIVVNCAVYKCARGTDDLFMWGAGFIVHRCRFKQRLPDNPNNEPLGETQADTQEQRTDEACFQAFNCCSFPLSDMRCLTIYIFIKTDKATSKWLPSALSVGRECEKMKQHKRCSLTPEEIKHLVQTEWIMLCFSKGCTFPITQRVRRVFCSVIMKEHEQKAGGDGGGESMWELRKIGHWVVRERMISRGFRERGNITTTTLSDTNEIWRKGANVSKSGW